MDDMQATPLFFLFLLIVLVSVIPSANEIVYPTFKEQYHLCAYGDKGESDFKIVGVGCEAASHINRPALTRSIGARLSPTHASRA